MSRGFRFVQARARVGSHLPCLMNCISLCSVRCSGGQQETLRAVKKSSSCGVGITLTGIAPYSASLANLEVIILA